MVGVPRAELQAWTALPGPNTCSGRCVRLPMGHGSLPSPRSTSPQPASPHGECATCSHGGSPGRSLPPHPLRCGRHSPTGLRLRSRLTYGATAADSRSGRAAGAANSLSVGRLSSQAADTQGSPIYLNIPQIRRPSGSLA